MKKIPIQLALIILINAIVARGALYIAGSLYGYHFIWDEIFSYLNYTIIAMTTVILVDVFKHYTDKKWVSIIIVIVGIVILLSLFIIDTLFVGSIIEPTKRHYFISPDGRTKLLLEEDSNITGCIITGYEVKYSIFKFNRDYSSAAFGEPDYPISEGNYKIEWEDYLANVTVYSDSTEEKFTVKFE